MCGRYCMVLILSHQAQYGSLYAFRDITHYVQMHIRDTRQKYDRKPEVITWGYNTCHTCHVCIICLVVL